MKNLKTIKTFLMAAIFMAIQGCEEPQMNEEVQEQQNMNQVDPLNANFFEGEIPEATVPLKKYASNLTKTSDETAGSTLTPSIEETLLPEVCHTETLTATINGGPAKGDVMFIMDLTGSMFGELANARNNSVNIMNQIRFLISDTNFGLSSMMDYPSYYSSCDYGSDYGASTDYPYRLDSGLITDIDIVMDKFNFLTLGAGVDFPESYSRALWELSNDEATAWRAGSKKIAIIWLDALPHDCEVLDYTFGKDPGRDGVLNTSDDIAFQQVLQDMADDDIVLFTLYSGNTQFFNFWNEASQITGGQAFQINSDGTIPDADLADVITTLISSNLNTIEELTLEVCDPLYESWLTSVAPDAYYDLTLDSPIMEDYEICITVPTGTPAGVYEFEICLMGDGAEYARTDVIITVPDENLDVAIDIHPTSCPNPLSLKAKGVLPVSINGSETFDVNEIDINTVKLEGLSPVRHSIADVSTLFDVNLEEPLDPYSCNTLEGDGYDDLVLKFDYVQLRAALGPLVKDDVLTLEISGALNDGTEFTAKDIVIVR